MIFSWVDLSTDVHTLLSRRENFPLTVFPLSVLMGAGAQELRRINVLIF